MGLSTTTDQQIDLPLEESSESPEVMILVQETKNGNEEAAAILLKKFDKALHGNYMKGLINFDFDKFVNQQDKEDIYSIINILFMETVNSYDPTRGKFITHLTNRIRFKFREYLLKERMIPVATNKTSKEVLEVLDKTRCDLISDIGDELLKAKEQLNISFKIKDETFKIPLKVFVSNFIIDKIDDIIPKKYVALYRRYLECIASSENGTYPLLAKEFDMTINKVHYSLRMCNILMSKSLKIDKNKISITTD